MSVFPSPGVPLVSEAPPLVPQLELYFTTGRLYRSSLRPTCSFLQFSSAFRIFSNQTEGKSYRCDCDRIYLWIILIIGELSVSMCISVLLISVLEELQFFFDLFFLSIWRGSKRLGTCSRAGGNQIKLLRTHLHKGEKRCMNNRRFNWRTITRHQ